MRARMFGLLMATLLQLVCVVAYAQNDKEFSVLSGAIGSGNERSIVGQMEYAQMVDGLGPLGFSVSYLNEGHLDGIAKPKHHRDGFASQIWAKIPVLNPRLTLGVGIGPYFWFDTASTSDALDANDHGAGVIASVNATYAMTERWDIHLRTNYVNAFDSFDTLAVLGGVGYKFDTSLKPFGVTETGSLKNQVTLLVGQTTINNVNNKHPYAGAIEYRRTLGEYVDWTVGYLDEGKSDLVDRRGGITQLWATQRFFYDRLDLGIGAGAYVAFDSRRDRTCELNGIISLTAGYRVYDQWGLRVQMHRVVTAHDRDSDVFLGGVGYHF